MRRVAWSVGRSMSNVAVDFYRCPEELLTLSPSQELRPEPGYFQFGPGVVCHGQSAFRCPAVLDPDALPDLSRHIAFDGSTLRLPFDATTIVDNLRFERYTSSATGSEDRLLSNEGVRRVYYYFRPILADSLRRSLQRCALRGWEKLPFPSWPVDTTVEQVLERFLLLSMRRRKLQRVPFIWFWPDGAPASAIITHDVETTAGVKFLPCLMDLDDEFGIKTSIQVVPEQRYTVSSELLCGIRKRQCEVNVHGLNHDGNLFRDRNTFLKQAERINRYVREFGAEGFRSACMYRNVNWYESLNISYDMSVPNVAHLEPQRGGCCTVFPYFVGKVLELPLTTIQDYSLFHILGDYSMSLWKRQIEIIRDRHGLITFIVHPDYVLNKRSHSVYKTLLSHLSALRRNQNIWIALPGDVNRWWRARSEMKLVLEAGRWVIKGRDRERARIGFASIEADRISYSVGDSCEVVADMGSAAIDDYARSQPSTRV